MSLEPRSLTVGGTRRNFWLAEPDGTASAIVLGLHGTRSNAPRQARLSAMASLARDGGAVVAFPEAIVPIGSGFEGDPEIDTAFLLELVDQLSDRYPATGGRACMTGMSGWSPDVQPLRLATNMEIDATERIWSFSQGHA